MFKCLVMNVIDVCIVAKRVGDDVSGMYHSLVGSPLGRRSPRVYSIPTEKD